MTPVVSDPAGPTRDELLAELAALHGKCVNRAVIEQAKGALMLTYGLTADAAFDLLRFHSQTGNVKLRAIAAELTALVSRSATSSRAITRFDRLLDTVTRSLHTPPGPAVEPAAAGATVDMAALFWQITAGRDRQAAPRPVPAAAPGITEAAPGVTIAANAPDLPLVYANDAFIDLTGYPVGDVLGRNCRFLQGAGTDPRDIATLSRALRTGRDVSVVLRNYRRDGSEFVNKVSVSPIRDPAGQVTHYIGTQIDITRAAPTDPWSRTRPVAAETRVPAGPASRRNQTGGNR